MKVPFNPLKYRYHVLRPWIIQPICFVLFFFSGVLDWFRVDMLSEKLIWMGQAYSFEVQYLMWIPIGFYGLVFLISIASIYYGRIFCGWSCPHNILTEWTRPIRAVVGREPEPMWLKRIFNRASWSRLPLTLFFTVLGIASPIILSVFLLAYFAPFDWIISTFAAGTPDSAILLGIGILSLIGWFALYTGHDLCRVACLYGMCQSMAAYQEGKWKPMEIGFTGTKDADCKTCTACQQLCPVDIDPRGLNAEGQSIPIVVGQFNGCFNCGACIDACKTVQTYQGRSGLLNFKLPKLKKTSSG